MRLLSIFLSLIFIISCHQLEDKGETSNQGSSSSSQVITAARHLLLDGTLELRDIKIGDRLRFEVSGMERYPLFRDERRLAFPEHRDDMGCWLGQRLWTGTEQKILSPAQALSHLRIMVQGELKPLAPWVEEIHWGEGEESQYYDLVIGKELADKDYLQIEFSTIREQIKERIGFTAVLSSCPDYLYRDLMDNPTNFSYVDQTFFKEIELTLSYQLTRE